MKAGPLATEDEPYDREPRSYGGVRARNEDALKRWATRGLRTSLPPIVHGPTTYGLASLLISIAHKNKESAYIGDRMNRWPSKHHLGAAHLLRPALEKGPAGGTYHAVGEEGIPIREIAAAIGRRLNLHVISKSPEETKKHFGFIAPAIPLDNPTSSKLTREWLRLEALRLRCARPSLSRPSKLDW